MCPHNVVRISLHWLALSCPCYLWCRLDLNLSAITWLSADGRRPTDGKEIPPQCLLEGLAALLDVTCDVAFVAVNIIGFGLLGIILIIAFLIIKRRLVILYFLLHNTLWVPWCYRMQLMFQLIPPNSYKGTPQNQLTPELTWTPM